MEATRIVAVRHGETAWNVDTRIQGMLDIPLNERGRWQADRLAKALADQEIDAVYSSDLGRAAETANATAKLFGLPVIQHPGLRERRFGKFEGKTFAEITEEWPEDAMRWRKRDPHFAPEGAETLVEFRKRISETLSEIALKHPGEHIMVVAHGGVLDVIYRMATGLELQAPRTWQLGNAAINRLLWSSEGLTLVGWSDTQHLDDESRDETST